MKLRITTTEKVATFVAPNGGLYKSSILWDVANKYHYVKDGNNEDWLLNEVRILKIDEYKRTEEIEMPDLIEVL